MVFHQVQRVEATRDPCFIIDLSVPDPRDLHLSTNMLKDYTLEFKVKVKEYS